MCGFKSLLESLFGHPQTPTMDDLLFISVLECISKMDGAVKWNPTLGKIMSVHSPALRKRCRLPRASRGSSYHRLPCIKPRYNSATRACHAYYLCPISDACAHVSSALRSMRADMRGSAPANSSIAAHPQNSNVAAAKAGFGTQSTFAGV